MSKPPQEPTARREATRQRLIGAAVVEFAARGIDATSVEHLTESAGFTRGAFYSNFSTKDDLCIAVLEWHRDQIMERLTETFGVSDIQMPRAMPSLDWALQEALPMFFGSPETERDKLVTLVEIRLRATRSAELRARLQEFDDVTRPMMIKVLENLRDTLDVELALEPSAVLELLQSVYFSIVLSGSVDTGLVVDTVRALIRPPSA